MVSRETMASLETKEHDIALANSLVTVGSSQLKENSIPLLNKLLVIHWARCGFEIPHFHSPYRIERKVPFMVNQAFN